MVERYSKGPQAIETSSDKPIPESRTVVQNQQNSSLNVSANKGRLDDILKEQFFYNPSFEIYDIFNGKYDLGPMGCAVKSNLLQNWKSHFVMEEQMLEIDSSILTLEPVLK